MPKKIDEENKLISKIDNKYEFRAYLFKYHFDKILLLLVVVLLGAVILQQAGFDFSGLFDSITSIFTGGKK